MLPEWLGAEVKGVPVKDFPIPHFGKESCHHANWIKLHNAQKSTGSAAGDKHPADYSERGDRATKNKSSIMCLMASAY